MTRATFSVLHRSAVGPLQAFQQATAFHQQGRFSEAGSLYELVLETEPRSDLDRAEKRLEYLAEGDLDVAVFQSLPLHIRSRVLKEGTVLYARDEDALYAVAIRTARAWEGFRHIHRQYLDEILRG